MLKSGSDLVAQLVEQYTFNVWALGSSPSGITGKTSSKIEEVFLFQLAKHPDFMSGVPWGSSPSGIIEIT